MIIRISLYNVRMYRTILAVNHGCKLGDLVRCKKWSFCYLRDYNFCTGNGKITFFWSVLLFYIKKSRNCLVVWKKFRTFASSNGNNDVCERSFRD